MKSYIDHISYVVTDLDKISLLMQQLGYVEIQRTNHHGGALEMKNSSQPELTLEFTLVREGETLGFNHVCFKVEDIQAITRLEKHDFPFTDKQHFSPGSNRHIINFKDCDKNKWQLTF